MSTAKPIIIGIDQGTTNSKALALDGEGGVLAEVSRPIATSAPRPGWVEQDAEAMAANVVACVEDVLAKTGQTPASVAGIGIANQTETLVIWDPATAKPVMPAIVWQCRRGGEEIAPLQASSDLIRARTGLDLDPTFTAAKLKWVFHNRPDIAEGLRRGDLLFGTVDTWLMWKLSGGEIYASEPSNASRTMLFDIGRLAWDPELISLFALDIAHWPEIHRSDARFGATEPSLFGAAIPITGAMGDQQAALFGLGCFDEFQLKVTYGTGAFVWVNAGKSLRPAPAPGIIRTVAWQREEVCYAYEGFVMYAGKILDWLAQRLAMGDGAAIAAAAERARTSDGVLLVPAFQGLASPWWQPDLRAALLGMSEATGTDHVAHAGLEAVCYQIRAILDAIGVKGGGPSSPLIKVDGGMTRSRYFLQLQADVLQLPLSPVAGSATPFGAGLMAGLGAGIWRTVDDIRPIVGAAGTLAPNATAAASYDAAYGAWRRAIDMLIAQYGRSGLK